MRTDTKKEAIVKALKAAGYTSREVSVKSEKCTYSYSYRATIRAAHVHYETVKSIVKGAESVRYCQASGEILSGGNTYTSLSLSDEVYNAWVAVYLEEVKTACAKIPMEGSRGERVAGRFIIFREQEGSAHFKIYDNKSDGWFTQFGYCRPEDIALDIYKKLQEKATKQPARAAAAPAPPVLASDLRQITARFHSKCAETGRHIPKGEICYYDKRGKRVYHPDSMKGQEAAANMDRGTMTIEEDEYLTAYAD